MEVNKIYQGTCLDVIKTFSDKSIDCVITSPPYWQLRDYGWDGQWGNEPTFQMYLENLWSLMDEIWRVLKDNGTVWVNLGDTYGTQGGKNTGKEQKKYDSTYIQNRVGVNGEEDAVLIKQQGFHKCLLLIPHRFAIGCIDRGWIIRNDIIWAKRNGMPESVTDRFSKKHEYFFFMVKNEKYYFSLDEIKDQLSAVSINRYKYGWNGNTDRDFINGPQNNMNKHFGDPEKIKKAIEGGKNPGDVSDFWAVSTKGSKDKHYAQFNTELIDKCIVAGCPIGGIILDPFCGTATTGCRAIELQRKFIGIDGKPEYVAIGNKKLHPFQITQQLF